MISKIVALFALLNVSYAQPRISKEGEVCGGMLPELAHTCAKPLECVNTKGPLIADAPGSCKPKCPTKRDAWGNCVPKNCEIWSDGCNTCHFKDNKLTDCSEKKCFDVSHKAKCERYSTNENDFFHCAKYLDELSKINEVCCAGEKGGTCSNGFPEHCSPECASTINLLFNDCEELLKVTGLDKQKGWPEFAGKCKKTSGNHGKKVIPKNCATWFDGCNRCSVNDGKVRFCTRRACLRLEEPACVNYHNGNSVTRERGRQCFDGKDNDHDGKSDCADSDCQRYGRCRRVGGKETGRMCFDHRDNDHDGKADCDDEDCKKDPRARWHCKHTETGRECFDGKDNDNDGKTDCNDPDCRRDPLVRQRCHNRRNNRDRRNDRNRRIEGN